MPGQNNWYPTLIAYIGDEYRVLIILYAGIANLIYSLNLGYKVGIILLKKSNVKQHTELNMLTYSTLKFEFTLFLNNNNGSVHLICQDFFSSLKIMIKQFIKKFHRIIFYIFLDIIRTQSIQFIYWMKSFHS